MCPKDDPVNYLYYVGLVFLGMVFAIGMIKAIGWLKVRRKRHQGMLSDDVMTLDFLKLPKSNEG